jgi:hypothetical protein
VSKRGPHSPADGRRSVDPGGARRGSAPAASFDEVCARLASRLRTRFPELEASLATLVDGVSNRREVADYLESLHATRPAVLGYIADVLEVGERHAPDVPDAVLAAVRLAARSDVPLDAVLRRYAAANAFIGDILLEEAERVEVSHADLRRVLHRQATLFERLLEAVSEEYTREVKRRLTTTGAWRHRYIQALLLGRLPNDEVELDYDLDGHHLALLAKGPGADGAMRTLAKGLDRRLLAGRAEDEPVWACWLGGRSRLEAERAQRALGEIASDQLFVALGEPGEGLPGWRLSHRQAKAALPIAERRGQHVVRYAEVAVLASVLLDDLGALSLRRIYLEPLEAGRDGGKAARETLRAYFAAERNVSSAAAALGVDRSTVKNRIQAVEELFGRPLGDFATDLEVALRLAD